MTKFQRPADLKFPFVYHTFQAKEIDKIVECRIQDLPEEDFDRATDLMTRNYIPDENLSRCRGILNDSRAIEEYSKFWRNTMKEKVSVACYKNDGSDELVGVNVLAVSVKGYNPIIDLKTESIQDIFDFYKFIDSHHNVYEKYGVDKFLSGKGLANSRDYRYRGIATEFLIARVPIMKALGLTATSTVFTAIGSQKAALKAGYEEVFAVKWSDIQERFPNFDFSVAFGELCKIIDLKIENSVRKVN